MTQGVGALQNLTFSSRGWLGLRKTCQGRVECPLASRKRFSQQLVKSLTASRVSSIFPCSSASQLPSVKSHPVPGKPPQSTKPMPPWKPLDPPLCFAANGLLRSGCHTSSLYTWHWEGCVLWHCLSRWAFPWLVRLGVLTHLWLTFTHGDQGALQASLPLSQMWLGLPSDQPFGWPHGLQSPPRVAGQVQP